MTMLSHPVSHRTAVPDDIWNATKGLLRTHPPTNPVVILRVADWWYTNGRGGNDPAFKYAVRWLDYATNENIATSGEGDDVTLFAELREYLHEFENDDGDHE